MNSKRVLLINPPFYRLMNSHFNGLSMGLNYIAAVLKENEHKVRIYNADYEKKESYSNQRELFEGYDNYNKILNNLDDPLWLEIREDIKRFSPDIVGISMLTGTYKSAENIGRIVKELDNEIDVVVGGVHPTVLPDETIRNKYFDYVIRGEGEHTFLDVVNEKPIENILGLTYMDKKNKIINNPDRGFIENLDLLPFPRRDLYLNDNQYMNYGYILTGRGCPFECAFCASKKIWKGCIRLRSPQNVVDEIKHVYENYDTNFFYFIDDTFTINKKRTSKICELIIENDLDITWICDTRVDTIDEKLLQLMKQSGCIRVKIGVESGSERILKINKKKITKEQIRSAVSLIKKVGIEFTAYLMIGFPTETKKEMQATLDFAKELDADYYSLSILSPYPGTEIYDDLMKNGITLPKKHWEYFFHQSRDMMLTDNIDKDLVDECLALNEIRDNVRI